MRTSRYRPARQPRSIGVDSSVSIPVRRGCRERSETWSLIDFIGVGRGFGNARSAASRRVEAARVPGMASRKTPKPPAQPSKQPILPHGGNHVAAASWLETACGTNERADRPLVNPNHPNQRTDRQRLPFLNKASNRHGGVAREGRGVAGARRRATPFANVGRDRQA